MLLYLAHHGHAENPVVDPQRPLSRRGRGQVETLARGAAARGVRPDVVWHSGKLRARQTAEAYWRVCNPLAEFSATRWMQPDDPLRVIDVLEVETRTVLLVGHMPHLDRLLRRLTRSGHDGYAAHSGTDTPQATAFPLNGLVALERTETGWVERWRVST